MKKWISLVVTMTCTLLVCVCIPLHQTDTQTLASAIQPDWWSDFGPNH